MNKISISNCFQQYSFGPEFLGCRNDAQKAKELFEYLRSDPLRLNEKILSHKFFLCCVIANIKNSDQIPEAKKASTIMCVTDSLVNFDNALANIIIGSDVEASECFQTAQCHFNEVFDCIKPYRLDIRKLIDMVVKYIRTMVEIWKESFQKNPTNTKILFHLKNTCDLYAHFINPKVYRAQNVEQIAVS